MTTITSSAGQMPASTLDTPIETSSSHTVERGETLPQIAQMYGVTVESLLEHNPGITNALLLYPGEALTIPPRSSSEDVVAQSEDASDAPEEPSDHRGIVRYTAAGLAGTAATIASLELGPGAIGVGMAAGGAALKSVDHYYEAKDREAGHPERTKNHSPVMLLADAITPEGERSGNYQPVTQARIDQAVDELFFDDLPTMAVSALPVAAGAKTAKLVFGALETTTLKAGTKAVLVTTAAGAAAATTTAAVQVPTEVVKAGSDGSFKGDGAHLKDVVKSSALNVGLGTLTGGLSSKLPSLGMLGQYPATTAVHVGAQALNTKVTQDRLPTGAELGATVASSIIPGVVNTGSRRLVEPTLRANTGNQTESTSTQAQTTTADTSSPHVNAGTSTPPAANTQASVNTAAPAANGDASSKSPVTPKAPIFANIKNPFEGKGLSGTGHGLLDRMIPQSLKPVVLSAAPDGPGSAKPSIVSGAKNGKVSLDGVQLAGNTPVANMTYSITPEFVGPPKVLPNMLENDGVTIKPFSVIHQGFNPTVVPPPDGGVFSGKATATNLSGAIPNNATSATPTASQDHSLYQPLALSGTFDKNNSGFDMNQFGWELSPSLIRSNDLHFRGVKGSPYPSNSVPLPEQIEGAKNLHTPLTQFKTPTTRTMEPDLDLSHMRYVDGDIPDRAALAKQLGIPEDELAIQVLVRHGESEANRGDYYAGHGPTDLDGIPLPPGLMTLTSDGRIISHADFFLSAKGEGQAKEAKTAISTLKKKFGIDTLISSPVARSQQTANGATDSGRGYAYKYIVEDYAERGMGNKVGLPKNDKIPSIIDVPSHAEANTIRDARGEETWTDFANRIRHARNNEVSPLLRDGKTPVSFTHQYTIAAGLKAFDPRVDVAKVGHGIPNGKPIVLVMRLGEKDGKPVEHLLDAYYYGKAPAETNGHH